MDGAVLENSVKLGRQHSHAHLDGVALPDGVDGAAILQGKKRVLGKLVDVHASAEDRSAAGRKAAGEDTAGSATERMLLSDHVMSHDIGDEVIYQAVYNAPYRERHLIDQDTETLVAIIVCSV